ncbi:glycosyl transferase [Microbacterium sp. NIBRBAC000506063]|uniref:glycosyl transferase n=1 Tax=Microbacterium sp. NIBRBAC000506063 TaxID=2734618 RepID=UPI001BB4B6B4|nr:glycosyl transferase [Microbacterium sp. NIBRBAC000506063]QTV79682.1 glycosyl transferase [Microbacterium sp. NIBRBAC000506063]
MRFVWAVLAFVLATLLIGAGIAQRTVFIGPKTQQTTLSVAQPEAYTLVDGAVLRTQAGAQTLLVRGEGEIFAAYGRTPDLQSWLADASYNAITVDDEGEIVVEAVAPVLVPEAEEASDAAEESAEPGKPGRDPAGSDLWLDEFTDEDALIADMQLPEGMSVLIARDGVEDAPTDIAVSWPLDNSTPLAGPLMVGGGLLMALGIVLYILAIRHQRRGRGPRRKGPGPLPPTEPIETVAIPASERAAIGRGTTQRRRLRLAVPALGLSVALLAGCSADSWPQLTESPTPTPTETVIAPENQQAPAVTESQATRILQRLAATIAEADEERDADLLATRMSGTPLAERRTDYRLRGKIDDREVPAAIPTEKVNILLPQAYDGWPRTVLILSEDTAAEDEESSKLVIFTMVQESPWEPYKLTYFADMQPAAELPDLAPAWLGTQLIPPASPFLSVAPEEVDAAFADVIDKGEDSVHYDAFDEAAQALAASVQESRESVVKALADHGAAKTSKVAFSTKTTKSTPVSLGTLDSGAIVAVDLVDTERVTPTSSDAVIKLGDNAEAEALTGVSEASKGVETRYSMQLFFSVPSQGSTEPIKLLAAHQTLLSVAVIK